MYEVKCPELMDPDDRISIFMAGGITDCPDWRKEVLELFNDYDIQLINPLRDNFDGYDANRQIEQIEWEFEHLEMADIILFYFCKETLNPITLYELGVCAAQDRNIFVACHPEYKRKLDVIQQLSLIKPEVVVHESIKDMVDDIINNFEEIEDFTL